MIKIIIKFKNGSTIEVIEPECEVKRSQPKEFQIEGVTDYYKNYPFYFLDLQGVKLYWWQKLFFRMSLNKLKFYNKIIK